MKAQTTQQYREKKPHTMQVNQTNLATSARKTGSAAQLSFDEIHARITARAYELYVKRGYPDGYHLEDWLEAERNILNFVHTDA